MSLSSEGSKEVRRLRYEIIRRRDRAEHRPVPTFDLTRTRTRLNLIISPLAIFSATDGTR